MNITGIINRVRVEQTFTNPSNEWVEGVYVFPLPEDSAVDQMTMHIGNKILEGQIKERRQAVKIYKKAKKEVTYGLRTPIIFSDSKLSLSKGVPLLGEHKNEILEEIKKK